MTSIYPATRGERALRMVPFAAVALISFAILPRTLFGSPAVIAAALLTIAIFAAVIMLPWQRVPRALQSSPAFVYLVVVGLLYHADGGALSGYGILALIPIVWLLVAGNRLELILAIVSAVGIVGLSHVLQDVTYPEGEGRRIVLFLAVITLMGLIVRQLIGELAKRSRMAEERAGELAVAERRMAEQAANLTMVVEATREFASLHGTDALREGICKAAVEVARADLALFFEPSTEGTNLFITAATDPNFIDVAIPLSERRCGASAAFESGSALFAPEARIHPLMSTAMVKRTGATSALFQPILREGSPVAVMALIWRNRSPIMTARLRSLVELLANEASNALERASLLARLAEMARTDELTGLPNRREWEGALAREMDRAQRSDEPLTVAMIDLDHFKRYNDRHGHQAGDRLLKRAAACWQNELRSTDVLARYGGEEFVLALGSCGLEGAIELADRLRAAMPGGETCSVGLAQWNESESAASLVDRADGALYKAKAAGRDRVLVANWLPSLRQAG